MDEALLIGREEKRNKSFTRNNQEDVEKMEELGLQREFSGLIR